MPTSRSIKDALGFIKSMQKLIQALKDVDAAHFQSLYKQKEKKFENFDKVVSDYVKLIQNAGDITKSEHPLLKPKSGCTGIIVITSDGSFMGKLNTAICKATIELMQKLGEVELVVIGKRGLARLRYCEARITSFPGLIESRRYEQAAKIKDYVLKQRMEGKIGDLYLAYARCLSFSRQEVEMIQLLPAGECFKNKGKEVIQLDRFQEICVESKLGSILEYLVQNWITRKLFEAAYESKLAEYAARSTHLEGSLEYLKGEIRKLGLQYNKARQSETDTGMRETFAALLGSSV